MDIMVNWREGINFTTNSGSGSQLNLGRGPEGFLPMELFAISHAGCTAMDVITILEKKRQHVTAFTVKVHADQAQEHPRVFTQAQIEYQITGRGIDEAAVLRSIELSSLRYCPAQAMFAKVIPISLTYSIYEDRGEAKPELTASGTYTPANETVND